MNQSANGKKPQPQRDVPKPTGDNDRKPEPKPEPKLVKLPDAPQPEGGNGTSDITGKNDQPTIRPDKGGTGGEPFGDIKS